MPERLCSIRACYRSKVPVKETSSLVPITSSSSSQLLGCLEEEGLTFSWHVFIRITYNLISHCAILSSLLMMEDNTINNTACYTNKNKHSSVPVYMQVCVCVLVPGGCKLLWLSPSLHVDLFCISSRRCVWVKHQHFIHKMRISSAARSHSDTQFSTQSFDPGHPDTLHFWATYLQMLQLFTSEGTHAPLERRS